MKKLLAIAAMTFAIGAHAQSWFQFEAGLGATHYTDRGDGTWYQKGAPQWSESLNAPAYTVGFAGPIVSRGKWGIDWHADYIYMSNASADCWCTPVDANYDLVNKRIVKYDPPLAHFVGSGHTQGAALMIEPYYTIDSWRVGVLGGAFINVPTWHETVDNWSMTPGQQTRSIEVRARSKVTVSPVVGLTVSRGNFSLRYQYFMLPAGDADVPQVFSSAHMLSLMYRF